MITHNTLTERKAEKERFEQEFGDQLKDTTISLEERWALFCAAIDQEVFHKLNYTCYSKILASKKNFCWYNTLYVERYETVKYIDVIDMLEDQLEDALDPAFSKTLEDCAIQSIEELDALKEEFLATGCSAFEFDW